MNRSLHDAHDTNDARAVADRTVVARMANGDPSALGELYDRHAGAVYSLAYRILGQTADVEEVTQDVFSQAWRQAGRYQQQRAPVGAWLLMMTRARAIERLRARRVQPGSAGGDDDARLEYLPDRQPSQERAAIFEEEATRVRAALAGLPEPQRTAIELAYYSGLTQAEIAEKLREPLGTVKTRVRSGLLKLRAALQGN